MDGRWISEEIFAELVEEVQRAVARMRADGKLCPTVFEIETAIAFLYFRKMKCDVVVLETGLGGGEDATNIVKNTAIAAFATISGIIWDFGKYAYRDCGKESRDHQAGMCGRIGSAET